MVNYMEDGSYKLNNIVGTRVVGSIGIIHKGAKKEDDELANAWVSGDVFVVGDVVGDSFGINVVENDVEVKFGLLVPGHAVRAPVAIGDLGRRFHRYKCRWHRPRRL